MEYYKHKKTNEVYAYSLEQLANVSRLSELELIIEEKEPVFIEASNNLELKLLELNAAKEQLAIVTALSDDENTAIDNDERIQDILLVVENKAAEYDEALIAFNHIESEYQPLKSEYEAISPIFSDVRENLKIMKKMTAKEIDAHLNPPISKEQLINETEQEKQTLLAEATEAIAPLQDAIDLGMATDKETSSLKNWKTYRVLLNRVDTSTAPDIEWPTKP